MQAINAIMKKQQDGGSEEDDEEDEEAWEGIDGDVERGSVAAKPGGPIEGHEDEYVDEDRYTTVTVEPMTLQSDEEQEDEKDDGLEVEGGDGNAITSKDGSNADGRQADGSKKKRVWTKTKPPSDKKKPKKTKFRYESKADRKSIRTRQSLKNKAAARARKGED